MSVRILDNGDTAAFYCSTSEVAFGPLVHEDGDHAADERAEAFLRWLPQDARRYDEAELLAQFSAWLVQEAAQWAREAGCQGCGATWEGDEDDTVMPPAYCEHCADERARDAAAEQAHDLWNDGAAS
jgi:hypothetical protein